MYGLVLHQILFYSRVRSFFLLLGGILPPFFFFSFLLLVHSVDGLFLIFLCYLITPFSLTFFCMGCLLFLQVDSWGDFR